jgi:hypothetical protein
LHYKFCILGTIATIPPPVLSPSMWTEPDASTFRVRGESYNADKVKIASAPSLFKLIAIDLFEVPEPTPNIASHPRNRVCLAHQRGDPAWVFVVNIMVPGPPYLSFVAYLQGDKVINFDCLALIIILYHFIVIRSHLFTLIHHLVVWQNHFLMVTMMNFEIIDSN